MKAEQLRKSILQLAIQGKLVPQDPADEPASVLLERIRAEKQRLIKEGKIKKDKGDSVIFKGDDNCYYEKTGSEVKNITDEIDFDLPDGWEYIRLSSIAYLSSGFTPAATELNSIGKIPYFKVSDMNTVGNEKYLSFTVQYYTGNKIKKIFPCNTIVFPKNGGAVFTNKKRILLQPSVVDLNTGALIPYGIVNTEYLFLLFSSIDFREHYKGTALPTVDANFVGKLLFGLPPLSEQERIVAEIEKFEPLIAEYDKLEQQATKLDSEIYDKLKRSILQYAIQGKLVPQDSNDEPAAVLLERIRAEKKAQLGKKYVESYIFKGDDNCYYGHINGTDVDITEEIPFDLPDSWAWSRWGELSDSIQYGYNAPAKQSGRIKMVRISDIHENQVMWENVPYCDIAEEDISTYLLKENDILFARTGGTVGKSFLVQNIKEEAIYAGYLIRTRYNSKLIPQYFKYFMESPLYWSQLRNGTIATAQPNCNGQTLSKMIVPVPPLNEQNRIVEKIDEIFAKL